MQLCCGSQQRQQSYLLRQQRVSRLHAKQGEQDEDACRGADTDDCEHEQCMHEQSQGHT